MDKSGKNSVGCENLVELLHCMQMIKEYCFQSSKRSKGRRYTSEEQDILYNDCVDEGNLVCRASYLIWDNCLVN